MSKQTDPRIAALRKCDFFASLRDKDLTEVAKRCDPVSFEAGAELMEQNARSAEAFVINRGQVSVVVDGETIATIGAGEVLGEVGLLDRGPRTATVVADTDVDAFVIAPREFYALLDDFPALSRKVTSELSQRLRSADEALN